MQFPYSGFHITDRAVLSFLGYAKLICVSWGKINNVGLNIIQACDIKDPKQNIEWTVPEGGGGPGYSVM